MLNPDNECLCLLLCTYRYEMNTPDKASGFLAVRGVPVTESSFA